MFAFIGIHNSPLEEVHVEEIQIPRRKTRNNKQKENCESVETVSKKKHYVRYPSEEESVSASQLQAPHAKKLLRATLQELNVQHRSYEETESDQKPIRTTRRTKKIEDDIPAVDVIVEVKKKAKKKKNIPKDTISHDGDANKNENNGGKIKVSKKKKKKRSSSIIVEEIINPVLEKSNMSNDSFHSAAGSTFNSPVKNDDVTITEKTSPIHEEITYNTNTKIIKTTAETYKDVSKENHNVEDSDICAKNKYASEKKNEKGIKKRKTRKRSLSPQQNDYVEDIVNKKVKSQDVDVTNIKKGMKKKSKKSKEIVKGSEIETVLNGTFEKDNFDSDKKDSTFDKIVEKHNITYDKESEPTPSEPERQRVSSISSEKLSNISITKAQKSNSLNSTYDKTPDLKKSSKNDENTLNTTFEKQSISINSTFEKDKISPKLNSTFEKVKPSPKVSSKFEKEKDSPKLNSTFDKISENSNLNTTFDKSPESKKSSLLSSDRSNITDDKSNDSRISVTSDDSKENIVNTTPVLIESSMEESVIMEKNQYVEKDKSPIDRTSEKRSPVTPLKREGTFTKETSSPRTTLHQTPSKRASMPSPGRTPFPSKSSSKEIMLNVTRSIEKSRRSSILELPRATKVMFCSPVNNPVIASQMKGKVIKSNLKGSNKSFIFNESGKIFFF